MQIVIEIPESVYERTKRYGLNKVWKDTEIIEEAIYYGIPLPKDHGRLIDADALKTQMPSPIEDEYKTAHGVLDDAPTIIEASDEGDR